MLLNRNSTPSARGPKRTLALMLIAALTALLAVPLLAQPGKTRYEVKLAPLPRDGREPNLTGEGHVRADLYPGNQLSISGNFHGFTSDATEVSLLESHLPGMRGEPVALLNLIKAPNGTFWGTIPLTDAQAKALAEGRLYIQVDSQKAEDGTIWGWLHK